MSSLAFLLAGVCLGQTAALESLELGPGRMEAWECEGHYYLTSGSALGPRRTCGVCTSDAGSRGRTGKVSRTFVVPASATFLRCKAFSNLGQGCSGDHRLDVVLMDENRLRIPKMTYTASGWLAVPDNTWLEPRWQGMPRDYSWDVSRYRGQTVKLLIRDEDERPGCHVYATAIELLTTPVSSGGHDEFSAAMWKLQEDHKLPLMGRFDSKRFAAISNASDKFTRQHLTYCEVFYDLFLDHFRRHGFTVEPNGQRLMLAMFCEPTGFEAYLGRKMPAAITGVYHTPSNRLVLYDLSQNAYLLARRHDTLKKLDFASPHDRLRVGDTVERRYQDAANDMNVGTTMHECAHLLSFNSGLLHRNRDVPIWLAEGLATYCESTNEGDWQALGSPNPMRIADLRRARGNYLSLSDLLNDGWLRSNAVILGYAQSWALFHMLMRERPAALNKYMKNIASRNAPEYRVADFREGFGHVENVESRYRAYLEELIVRYPPRQAR